MDLFNLLAKLTIDTSGYKKQMNEALDDAENFAQNLKKVLAGGAKLDTKEFKKSLGSAKSDASAETKSLGNLIKTGLQTAASAASGAVKGAFDKLPPGLQTAAKAVSTVVKGVTGTIKEVGSFAAKVMSGVAKTVGAVAKPIIATVKATAKAVTATISTTVKAVSASIKTIGKVVAAGVGAVGTAVVAISKKSLDAYANYEQLVGGVETLFKDNAGLVQQYAANAYKTAGLSANQYMETVTGFSASLLQSVGNDTKKAAKLADMAIIDMSDNANKMGTSMESIQNALKNRAA